MRASQIRGDGLVYGADPESPARHAARVPRLAPFPHGLVFEPGFIEQAIAQCKHRNTRGRALAGTASFAERRAARCSPALELRERGIDAGVGGSGPCQFRSSASRPCAKLSLDASADEVAAVLAQDFGDVLASGSQPSALQTNLLTSSLEPSE